MLSDFARPEPAPQAAQVANGKIFPVEDIVKPAPAAASDGAAGDTPELFDSIAQYLEDQISATAPAADAVAGAAPVDLPLSDPFAATSVEISTEMFVEILEAITSAAASWWALDENANFAFDKKLKDRYSQVVAMYAKQQNVKVSPGFLVGAFTVLLIGSVGWKAHQRRQAVLKVRAFRARAAAFPVYNSAGQTAMQFPGEHPAARAATAAGVQIDIPDRNRKDFSTEMGVYVKSPDGVYLKKSDRTQTPSPAIADFISEFSAMHGRAPGNKEIKSYLKTL